jgi:hypothetical protein
VKQEQDLVIIVEGILDELEEMVSQAEASASDRGRDRWGRTSKTNEWIRLVKENDN